MFSLRIRRRPVPIAILAFPLLAAGLLAPTPGGAQQAITAYTTANVNQRAGPGTNFPVIVTVPVRARIGLYGCLRPVDWCDVEFNRTRGWMSADYIQAWYQGQYYPLRQVSRQLNVAVVTFDIDAYWRAYYRDRPFYADLPRWRAPDRPPAITVNVFYDRLAPHGRWVWLNGRYVWVPAGVGPDWRPYTRGRWVYTQRHGWMWVSDEPFGWATYHYGRWAFSKRFGWFWVPDTRWGPAWVSWRGSDDYLAWAPLPPSRQEGFHFDISVGTVPDYYWQVVPAQSFLTINIFNVIIKDRDQSHAALQQAEPLGTVEIVDDQAVNAAVPVVFVEEKTEEPVVALQVVETDNPDQAGTTEGDAIEVFTPSPEPEATPEAPPEVTPIEVVEEESETKDQAGEEPATEDLVEPPPEPEPAPAEEPPAEEPAPTGEEPPPAEEEEPPPLPPADGEEPPPPADGEEPPPPPPADGEEPPPPPPADGEEPPPPPPADGEEPPPLPAEEEPPPLPAEEEPPPPPAEEEEPPPPPPAEEEEPPPPPAEEEEPPPPPPVDEEEPPPPPPAEEEEPPPPPPAEEEPPPPPPPPEEEPPPTPPEPEPAPPPPPEPPPPVEEEPPPPPEPEPEEPCPEGTERQPDGSCA